ncbi:MAG: hypothetical protein E7373_02455 [Clostridiales bacterium]|nr:hypothetical protein [Clostridiales bacterium]
MDNKLTKRRLSDFLAYEWITMIIIAVVAIVVWEFVYTVASVRLSVGQEFKFYYDYNLDSGGSSAFYQMIIDNETLSYDVLSFDSESLTKDSNQILSARLSIKEGDVMFTDCVDYTKKEGADENTSKEIRVKTLIDNYYGYAFTTLRDDAISYLKGFLPDGVTVDEEITFDMLSKEKIESTFRQRMKKDNRFRNEEQIQEGIKLEEQRLKDLCEEVKDFSYLLSLSSEYPELFYNYTRYEQSFELEGDTKYKGQYQTAVEREKEEGRENVPYALRLSALKGGANKNDPSKYFRLSGSETADDVVAMVFNFRSDQPHLQYETISFINQIVRDCSTLLD